MDSIKSQLLAMGFKESRVIRALESCPEAQTLEQIMEWLIAHEEELNNDASMDATPKVAANGTTQPTTSMTCEAAKGESPGDKESPSDESAQRKKKTVEDAQRIIAERLIVRAEEERKKEIEDEKRRRIDGQKMAETRAELQDQERIRLAQQIRREKMEKELHRKQVLEQIARDREAMKMRSAPQPTISTAKPPSNSTTKDSQSRPSASECRIALRFPDGSSLVQQFSPQEQLSAVKLYVQMEKGASEKIEFVAPPNKKLDEAVMNETLESLGLCPASRLEVKLRHIDWEDVD